MINRINRKEQLYQLYEEINQINRKSRNSNNIDIWIEYTARNVENQKKFIGKWGASIRKDLMKKTNRQRKKRK